MHQKLVSDPFLILVNNIWPFYNIMHERVKVARVVILKLTFTELFFYNLIILIKLYKIWYLNLDKVLLFPRNQVVFLKNWKLWRAPTIIKFNIFCWNFAHASYLTMSTKGCSEFFFILFKSWVIMKNIKKRFLIFANNSRFKQNKKFTNSLL